MQTIGLAATAGLTGDLKIRLFDVRSKEAAGAVAGYAVSEAIDGYYETSQIPDDLVGVYLVQLVVDDTIIRGTDFVWLTGLAGDIALVGMPSPRTIAGQLRSRVAY